MDRSPSTLVQCRGMRPAPNQRPAVPGRFDALAALAVSADLSSCELGESAAIVHRWLREHQPHDAVVVVADAGRDVLSRWTSPAFALPSGIDLSAADAARTLGRPIVAAGGEAAASGVTILVVLERRQALVRPGLDGVLRALARVIAARAGQVPAATDTAQMSLAHAVSAERERLTHELTGHFIAELQTILARLRAAAADESEDGVRSAWTEAARALAHLRERRGDWRQARRVDQAFAAVEREIGDVAHAADVRLESRLEGRGDHPVGNVVLEAASWITRTALQNITEQSAITRVRVEWRVGDEELAVAVIDDGRAYDPDPEARGRLRAMRRRAESLGGSLQTDSMAGWGTTLRAHLRLHAETARSVDESASALVRTLGGRQLDVLRLLAVGHRNRDIAAQLGLSQHTVKFHLRNIFEKLGVRTRSEAAAVAFAAGIHPRTAPDGSPSHG
jgi:DNA-binding CsgD family transcriptional regulator/signal transduction histidine kinase